MHDCFNLRFNIQKSGWDTPEDPALFAGMFSERPEKIRACRRWRKLPPASTYRRWPHAVPARPCC